MKSNAMLLLLCVGLLLLLCSCRGKQPDPELPKVGGEPLEITAFSFWHTAMEMDECFVYSAEAVETGIHLYTEELYLNGRVVDCITDEPILKELGAIAGKYHLDRWDGFDENNKRGSDGSSFTMSITLADGSTISARGNNCFPDYYSESVKEIRAVFEEFVRQYETEPVEGGHTNYTDPNAPKTIESDEIRTLRMEFYCIDMDNEEREGAYCFELNQVSDQWELAVSGCTSGSAAVDGAVAIKAQELIRTYGLISKNGLYDVVSGLPEKYMPCSVTVEYVSGERLRFTETGLPDTEWYAAFRDLFLQVLSEGGDGDE